MPRRTSTPSYRVLRAIDSPHENGTVRHYQIRQGGDSVVYCTCPGWRFRRTCRHLDEYHASAMQAIWDITPAREQCPHEAVSPASSYTATPRQRARIRANQQIERQPEIFGIFDGDKCLGMVNGTSPDDIKTRLFNGNLPATARIVRQL